MTILIGTEYRSKCAIVLNNELGYDKMTDIVSKKTSRILLFLLSFLFIFNSNLYSQHLSLKQSIFCDSTNDRYRYWSLDGKHIAFSSTRADYWAVWLMEPDMDYIKNKLSLIWNEIKVL